VWYCDSTAAILQPPASNHKLPELDSPADSVLTHCGAGTAAAR
jgi:hypothetical protein